MLSIHKIKRENGYVALFLALIFCLFQYGIMRIFGFSLFPDEFGYWAPAAKALGWDWSDTTSLGSYYSFGYSLLLAPILYFVKDSIAAYRVAVGLNVVLMAAGLVLLCRILEKLFVGTAKSRLVLIGGIAALYPVWIFYTQLTMTEALLLFLYVLVCYLFLCFLEKPGMAAGGSLAAALAYMYFVHMRSIGTVLAVCIALFLLVVWKRDKRYGKWMAVSLVVLCLFFVLGGGLKEALISGLYQGSSGVQYNDYSGQWGKLAYLFSLRGLWDFLLGLVGKILYLSLATYGLGIWGVWYIVKRVWRVFRQGRTDGEKTDFFWVFLLLSLLGQMMVTCIYTIGSNEADINRVDLFVHGRYNDMLMPMLMAVGIWAMGNSRKIVQGTGLAMGCQALCSWIVWAEVVRTGIDDIDGFLMVGMCYTFRNGTFQPDTFFLRAWLLGTGLTVLFAGCIWIVQRFKEAEMLLLFLAFLQVGLAVLAGEHYIYWGNAFAYGDIQVADKLLEVLEDAEEDTRVVHFYDKEELQYIELVQFRLRDKRVEILTREEQGRLEGIVKDGTILITQDTYAYNEELKKIYRKYWQSGHLVLFYE